MAQEYFPAKKPVTEEPHSPVLTEDDEAFLTRITSAHPSDPNHQVIIFDEKGKATRELGGADQVPLPTSPPAVEEKPAVVAEAQNGKGKGKGKAKEKESKPKQKRKLHNVLSSIRSSLPISFGKKQDKSDAAEQIQDIATSVKTGEPLVTVSKEEEEKEKQDMTSILDELNLSAVNNRAFSFSKESKVLLDQFTQILKDLINGVPTAYNDLEDLLTNKDKQLKDMFDKMPPFLQNLVKSLPTKMTATLAPGLMAAASEKPGADGKLAAEEASASKISMSSVPLLKNLVKTDAIVAMLKSILNFLKFRFPTFVSGTNILLSLAIFLLLFVFWYCHKRGKEVRLEKERLAAEGKSDAGSTSELENSTLRDTPAHSQGNTDKLEQSLNHPAPATIPLPETPNAK